jgi:hypothetical protein
MRHGKNNTLKKWDYHFGIAWVALLHLKNIGQCAGKPKTGGTE